MATITDSLSNTLEEKIVPTIFESLWDLDPVYPMIRRSSMNVVRNRGIGKGWKILKTWVTGVAGGAKFMSAAGGNVLSGPLGFTMYDTPQSFQAVDEVTAPATFQSTVGLVEHRGCPGMARRVFCEGGAARKRRYLARDSIEVFYYIAEDDGREISGSY